MHFTGFFSPSAGYKVQREYRKYIQRVLQIKFGYVKAYHPSKQFFSHVGIEPPFPGYYQYFLGSKCVFAQGHNTAEVGIEPPTTHSGVRGSTTRPTGSLQIR